MGHHHDQGQSLHLSDEFKGSCVVENLQYTEQSLPRVALAMAHRRNKGCTSRSGLGAVKLETGFCYFGYLLTFIVLTWNILVFVLLLRSMWNMFMI
jgi:hypothetical protein